MSTAVNGPIYLIIYCLRCGKISYEYPPLNVTSWIDWMDRYCTCLQEEDVDKKAHTR